MPTRTTPRTSSPAARVGRKTQPPTGRFGRTPAARPSTRTAAASRIAARRKPPKRSPASKALNGLAGLVPGSVLGKAAKPSPGSGGGKGGKVGFALLAGAAGLALKNRDKLPGPLGRRTEEPYEVPPAETTPITPDPLATSAAAPSTNASGTPSTPAI